MEQGFQSRGGIIDTGQSRELLTMEWMFEHGASAVWRDLCAPFFDVSQIQSDRMRATMGAHVWRIGPLVFWRSTCGGQILRRTLNHLSEFGEHVLVTRYVSGRTIGSTDLVPFQVRAGEVAVRNLERPFSALQYPSVVESMLIPRRFIAAETSEGLALRVFNRNDLIHKSLLGLFQEVFRTLRMSTGGVPSALVDRVFAVVREAAAQPHHSSNLRRASRDSQLRAMQAYIEQNLGRLDLSADEMLPNFGVSRATLYRMFEVFGGVRNYIVDRRLFHALIDISAEGAYRGKIQRAAKQWGFSSAANFNRSVQSVFGCPPGALFKFETETTDPSQSDSLNHQSQARELLIG
ncbi:MAG: AraC family transcriptional regulator [Pseudomonadota bacterium]